VLYFVGDVESLRATARRLAGALAPGGLLLTAHAHLVVDEPERTGFDWGLPFGAKVIGETLEGAGGLQRVRELRTPLYRVTLLRRPLATSDPPPAAEIVEAPHAATLPDAVAARVLWKGGSPRGRAQDRQATTERLPILMYHRVAPSGSDSLARWRVTPAAFEEQLAYLRDTGYRSVTLAEWRHAAAARRALNGRAVLLTFDDGYADFAEHAWPLLQRYGFGATVFLVSDRVGEVNLWDRPHAEALRLMDWTTLRELAAQGVVFGAHSASHPPLTALDPADVVREGCRSLVTLARELGLPPSAFAYPYGDTDGAVQRLIGACGYVYGLGVRAGCCRFDDPLLDLPRIEVRGDDRLGQFVAKLES
jgi:peptidoglycan/xylan/chitin deacetylase (PgdA/CDA1 family)